MAVNQYMHPRNIYKTPPDFNQLANCYQEFQDVSLKDDRGNVHVDFKDPKALRVLTKCLLHRDFNLDVYIPKDRLVPTLPLRLNYILWIEDLLSVLEIKNQVKGVDIGTGACAIYPLLGASKNKWKILGTENDETSYKTALENVKNNNLEHLITLKLNATESLLAHCFCEESIKYDFCMCNPPFYSSFQDLLDSRNNERPPPKNAFTGSLPELITEGGEVKFVTRIIDESITLQNKISIFTTMVGHKSSVKQLVAQLRERGIQHTHTEFCQGHTMRWGLAWTFLVHCDLQLAASAKRLNRKKNTCMAFIMQPIPGMIYDCESASNKVKEILNGLGVTYKLFKKKGQKISLEIKAYTNTWSNQRRKRRQQKREIEQMKKFKSCKEETQVETNEKQIDHSKQINIVYEKNLVITRDKNEKKYDSKILVNSQTNLRNIDLNDSQEKEIIVESNDKLKNGEFEDNLDYNENAAVKLESIEKSCSNNLNTSGEISRSNNEERDPCEEILSDNTIRIDICDREKEVEVILHAILSICKLEADIVLDMEYLSGNAGKDGMHQVVQFIKNNWK